MPMPELDRRLLELASSCRYAGEPDHRCARRGGAPLYDGETCFAEAAAQSREAPALWDDDVELDSPYPCMADAAGDRWAS